MLHAMTKKDSSDYINWTNMNADVKTKQVDFRLTTVVGPPNCQDDRLPTSLGFRLGIFGYLYPQLPAGPFFKQSKSSKFSRAKVKLARYH